MHVPQGFREERKILQVLTQLLLELRNIKCSVFTHCILRFLTPSVQKLRYQLLFLNTKIYLIHVSYENQIIKKNSVYLIYMANQNTNKSIVFAISFLSRRCFGWGKTPFHMSLLLHDHLQEMKHSSPSLSPAPAGHLKKDSGAQSYINASLGTAPRALSNIWDDNK